ncbi:urea carboxylase [Nibricoccus aquaticus]|uniref:Urea carboxylase n=1 Tax=Nibricoccus aquaticus TaxID=2576891 RepID=A0A290Q9D4_9BACT|nr:urea carboxylase [Nibricoccus aquaticus]ATC65315.1 urea carboxylase [Nibricoccus aquaticus]
MFTKVLIANRATIACRIERTLRRMNIKSVAVYSEADTGSLHVDQADEAVLIGPPPAAQSYLVAEKILAVARETGAQAIHPGYGFLSENAAFAEACAAAGIVFIGPKPDQMRRFGLKHTAREVAQQQNVPLLPGTGLLSSADEALREATRIGFPVMLKSTAGGGGIGMSLIWKPEDLAAAFATVDRLSRSNFKDSGIYLEKYVERARHIEVQIFGDGKGHVVALGERECSIQRRNQKIIEETPAPCLPEETRTRLLDCAEKLGRAVGYESAGTVEFVYDDATNEFYFLEVNTRLQVEHGVTEEVTGIDLVEWMIKQAAGELDLSSFKRASSGASIQVRLYSEDPGKNFQPATGTLTEMTFPRGARIETWIARGSEVSPFYDPMIAKIIVRGADRTEALARLEQALADTHVSGLETNLLYLRQIAASDGFRAGRVTTRFLEKLPYTAPTISVLDGGTQTTVQDYPGRLGHWDVGVPPSGPMDALAFRLGNRLVGNPPSAAGLEITLTGPSLIFNTDAIIALTGATTNATLDDQPLAFWQTQTVRRGQTLRTGTISGAGMRAYLSVRHGFDIPDYLGSKATFTLGQFGGHAGRALRAGDVLRVNTRPVFGESNSTTPELPALPAELIPAHTREWDISVLYGPHGAPDFFQPEDIVDLFDSTYEVHFNSARTGVRLIGPKPRWARKDGGEAGLHPSNIHDNAYAIGTIDFTGDMPIILGPDGPSLGGFVCPATIIAADLWKIGQLKPGDKIRFQVVTAAEARIREAAQEASIETLQAISLSFPALKTVSPSQPSLLREAPVLHRIEEKPGTPAVAYRRSGDKYLLVEYGPLVLDLNLRFRVHALMQWLAGNHTPGLLDLTPGIRSLQIHYESRVLPIERLLETLISAERHLPSIDDMEVPTRIVHLPLSWEDESTLLAIRKYMQTVRKDAPWCPSNIEFIRRINGLDSIDDVKRICFDASYLVLGLGDVYLGAPVATPVDPRHRLVTTKYNPARTWTPENAVGIGGAYMCVYGMEGPGGYQFIGRTVQMWNRWRQTADFKDGKPWLLRFFDQVRFYECSPKELLKFREDFPLGRHKLRVEEQTFRLRDYQKFLTDNASSITAFKTKQQASFDAERHRWELSGQLNFSAENESAASSATDAVAIPAGCNAITAQVPGNVWKITSAVGDKITRDQPLAILESMKMEISVLSTEPGEIVEIRCTEGKPVNAGDIIAIIRP